jgi:outer membrane protein TolC
MKWKLHLLPINLALSGVLAFAGQQPRDTSSARHITLHQAVQLALQHNHAILIAEYKLQEQQHAKEAAKSEYFPSIRNDSNFLHLTETQLIQINAGSLGTVAGSPVPTANAIINQGGRDLTTSGTQASMGTALELDARTLLLQSRLNYTEANDEIIHAVGRTPE